jgi:hypothetical protein
MSIQEAAKEVNLFDGPIPGQSMTASLENKMPWDGPPKYSSVREASEAIFLDLLEDENLKAVTKLMAGGTPITDVTHMLLVAGFSKGQFNPDLMMLLIEPIMYMLMAIADKVGITDVKMYSGEEEDEAGDDISEEENRENVNTTLQTIFQGRKIAPEASRIVEDSEITKKLENIDVEGLSLMDRPTVEQEQEPEPEVEQEQEPESLMAR